MEKTKIVIILILVIGAGLLLYYQTEKFFEEREVALQMEIQQAYDLGVEDGKVDLYEEWKEAGKNEVIGKIISQLQTTGELKLLDESGKIIGILVPKINEQQ